MLGFSIASKGMGVHGFVQSEKDISIFYNLMYIQSWIFKSFSDATATATTDITASASNKI